MLRLLEDLLLCFAAAESWIFCHLSLRLHGMDCLQNVPLKRSLQQKWSTPETVKRCTKQNNFLAAYR